MTGCCQQHNNKHEHEHEHVHEHEHGHGHDHKSGHAHHESKEGFRDLPSRQVVGNAVHTPIRIMQMDCPTEERLIRSRLENTAGVMTMSFNLMQRELLVVHQPQALDAILEAIKSLGFEPETAETDVVAGKNSMRKSRFPFGWKLPVAAILAISSEVIHWVEGPWLF